MAMSAVMPMAIMAMVKLERNLLLLMARRANDIISVYLILLLF
jgi:hypothetical protein